MLLVLVDSLRCLAAWFLSTGECTKQDWRLVKLFSGWFLHSFFSVGLTPLDEDIEDGIIVEEGSKERGTSVWVVEPNQNI